MQDKNGSVETLYRFQEEQIPEILPEFWTKTSPDMAGSLDTRKQRIDNRPSSRGSLCQGAHCGCASLTNPRRSFL